MITTIPAREIKPGDIIPGAYPVRAVVVTLLPNDMVRIEWEGVMHPGIPFGSETTQGERTFMIEATPSNSLDEALARLRRTFATQAEAALARAEDTLIQIEQGDDRAFTNGSYAKAVKAVIELREEVKAMKGRAA